METAEITKTTGIIHYGFGSEYLPKWGIKEALREIYQNFLDYGDYEEEVVIADNLATIKLTNAWAPANLEYLRIGNSKKDNPNAIGHHGEGLKMAFLILLREGFESMIFTNRYAVYPGWYGDKEIGNCFCFNYEIHDMYEAQYTLEFSCPADQFKEFKNNLLTDIDIVYSDSYFGDIVDRDPGNLYSGRLFVAQLEGLSRAYNIHPRHLPLDRDRCAPRSFDVEYATSKILEASKKLTVKDISGKHSDTRYIDKVPENILPAIKARRVGNDIQFTVKDETGKDTIIQHAGMQEHLKSHSMFAKAIAGIKRYLAKQLGVYDLLIAFKEKHNLSAEAKQDLDVILERINK